MSARKQRRTNPLMVVLMMELLARNLRRVPQRSAQLERAEYALRDRDMLWYFLRGTIWESWTKYVSHLTVSCTRLTYPQAEVGGVRGQDGQRTAARPCQRADEGLDPVDRRVLLL